MKSIFRLFPLLLGWSLLAHAAAPVEGRDYKVVQPAQPLPDPDHVVVMEFFSYYCPHCATFAPSYAAWVRKLPADVRVQRLPISLGRKVWEPMARTYLSLAAMNVLDKVDDAIFKALHEQRVNLDTEAAITKWLGTKGVDTKAFSTMYRSFGIDAQVRQAESQATAFGVGGTPMLVIDGRYRIEIDDDGNFNDQLAIASQLVEKARQQHRKK